MEKLNIMKVRQLENKNQYILEDGEKTIFQSYDSIIAVYDNNNKTLTFGCDWNYSKTTLKHLYIYLRDVIYYNMLPEQREHVKAALNSNNTRKALQKLIDKNIINYESELI